MSDKNPPKGIFEKPLFEILEEHPEILEELQSSRHVTNLKERGLRLGNLFRTGIVDEEYAQAQAKQLLETETLFPGSYEPMYAALVALIREHGEEEGLRVAQDSWIRQAKVNFHHIARLMLSFKR